jgi:hypothetical protein
MMFPPPSHHSDCFLSCDWQTCACRSNWSVDDLERLDGSPRPPRRSPRRRARARAALGIALAFALGASR